MQKRVLELRRANVSWAEVAEELGKSKAYCYGLYRQELEDTPLAAINESRQQEVLLVEDAVNRLIRLSHDPSITPRTQVEALNAIRGWSEHRAKLLGLNAPVKSQVMHVSESMVDAEIQRLANELSRKNDNTIDAEVVAELPPGQDNE